MIIGTEKCLSSDRRGSSPILFVAVFAVVVLIIGGIGVSMATDISRDTSERLETMEFELVSVSNIGIAYESGPLLTTSNTKSLVIQGSGDANHTIYTAESGGELRTGELVLTESEANESGIMNDMTVEVVLTQPNGDFRVVDEIYIPDEKVHGTVISSEGSVNVTGEVEFSTG